MRHEANGSEAGGPKITADWSVAAVTDERLHQLHTHWLALCGGRRMPSRGEFDPVHVPRPLLPHINLVDVMDPLDFRFRLVGTHWHDFVGQEVRGKLIGEVFPPGFCAEVREHWGDAVAQTAPKSGRGPLWIDERDYIRWQGVVLPLSAAGGNTVMALLVGAVFLRGNEAS